MTKKTSKLCIAACLWGESTSDQWIPSQRASILEDVSMPWRHHAKFVHEIKCSGIEATLLNLVLLIGIFRSSHDNAFKWMPQDLTDDKSTLVQVMAWCCQAITWATFFPHFFHWKNTCVWSQGHLTINFFLSTFHFNAELILALQRHYEDETSTVESHFNSLAPGRCGSNFKWILFKLIIKIITLVIIQNIIMDTHSDIAPGNWQRTFLMRSQHWFRQWLGAVRHQAITWVNVDHLLCHHIASLDHNKLMHWSLNKICWHFVNDILVNFSF